MSSLILIGCNCSYNIIWPLNNTDSQAICLENISFADASGENQLSKDREPSMLRREYAVTFDFFEFWDRSQKT